MTTAQRWIPEAYADIRVQIGVTFLHSSWAEILLPA